jgi:hypothetical protein
MRLITKSQWRKLSEMRLEEAEVLLAQKQWSGAYYLAGYAVECGFKAAICDQFVSGAIPERQFVINIYTHDLQKLRTYAQLDHAFDSDAAITPDLFVNWDTVRDWTEQSRYDQMEAQAAEDMVKAVNDPISGLIIWLQKHY